MGDKLKTWAPVIGSAVLVATIALRLLGHGDAAAAVETVSAALGISGQSTLNTADTAAVIGQLLAAGVAGWGVVRKVKSEVQKAQAKP